MLRLGPPHWSADPDFDLGYHVRRLRASEPGRPSTPCSTSRAPRRWPVRPRPPALGVHARSTGSPTARSAMIMKVHHSMTDGVGGLELLDGAVRPRTRSRSTARTTLASRSVAPDDLDVLTPDRARRARRSTIAGDARSGSRVAASATGWRAVAAPRRSTRSGPLSERRPRRSSRSSSTSRRRRRRARRSCAAARSAASLATLEVPLDRLKAAGEVGRGIVERRVRRRRRRRPRPLPRVPRRSRSTTCAW